MARQFGFRRPEDAIGQRANEGIIVGVVRDFHSASLLRAIPPPSMRYNKNGNLISIRLAPTARQPEAIAAVISQVEKLWRATYPNEKVSYTFFDDDIAKLYKQEQQVSGLMRLALVIATPVAWYFMYGWLKGFAYKTTVPWWIFGLCGLAAIVIALLTVSFQVLRAMRVNPAEALRAD